MRGGALSQSCSVYSTPAEPCQCCELLPFVALRCFFSYTASSACACCLRLGLAVSQLCMSTPVLSLLAHSLITLSHTLPTQLDLAEDDRLEPLHERIHRSTSAAPHGCAAGDTELTAAAGTAATGSLCCCELSAADTASDSAAASECADLARFRLLRSLLSSLFSLCRLLPLRSLGCVLSLLCCLCLLCACLCFAVCACSLRSPALLPALPFLFLSPDAAAAALPPVSSSKGVTSGSCEPLSVVACSSALCHFRLVGAANAVAEWMGG